MKSQRVIAVSKDRGGHELAKEDVGGFQASWSGAAARGVGGALLGGKLLRELPSPFSSTVEMFYLLD